MQRFPTLVADRVTTGASGATTHEQTNIDCPGEPGGLIGR